MEETDGESYCRTDQLQQTLLLQGGLYPGPDCLSLHHGGVLQHQGHGHRHHHQDPAGGQEESSAEGQCQGLRLLANCELLSVDRRVWREEPDLPLPLLQVRRRDSAWCYWSVAGLTPRWPSPGWTRTRPGARWSSPSWSPSSSWPPPGPASTSSTPSRSRPSSATLAGESLRVREVDNYFSLYQAKPLVMGRLEKIAPGRAWRQPSKGEPSTRTRTGQT